jgi:DNA-binding beta-propeller fold protein YncE
MWQSRYDGPASGVEHVASMGLSPDGSILYVTGDSLGSGGSLDYVTLALDTRTGEALWEARYDGPNSMHDSATHLVVSADGSTVYVTGDSIGLCPHPEGTAPPAGDWDYVTLAYEATSGERLWEARYHAHQRDELWSNSLELSPNGSTLFLNGPADCLGDGTPCNVTVAYDTWTGAVVWQSTFVGCLSCGEFGTRLAVSPDDRTLFLAGTHRNGETGLDYATLALDTRTGERLWVAFYDNGLHQPGSPPQEPIPHHADPTYDSARAVAVSSDATTVYVTGESRGRYGLVDFATVAYDASSGVRIAVARYDGEAGGQDRALSLAISPASGTVFVTGESDRLDAGSEIVTLAYGDGLDDTLWTARFDGGPLGRDTARYIAVSADGRWVTVAGESWAEHSADWIVLTYAADSGRMEWSARFDGPLAHADFCRGLVYRPDTATVFVAGHTCGCDGTDFDLSAVAYSRTPRPQRTTDSEVRPGFSRLRESRATRRRR